MGLSILSQQDKLFNSTVLLRLISEGIRFGIVGMFATGVHIGLLITFVEIFELTPVRANFIAYFVGFLVGFVGHFSWTFKVHTGGQQRTWILALLKFMVVSLIGLVLNTIAVYTVVNVLDLHYLYAVIVMITAIPAIIFLLNKFWAFA